MKSAFDPAKRTATLAARDLDMADADFIFAGSYLTVADDRKDYGDPCFITYGTLDGRMVARSSLSGPFVARSAVLSA